MLHGGAGVIENIVDVLDQEVSAVKDGVDLDFEKTCFEGVGARLEGIKREKIDVDKDEFRVTDNTLEDEEAA